MFNFCIHLGPCSADSGAPLWIENTETIAAVHFAIHTQPCGHGWAAASKLTLPKIWNWIRKEAGIV